MSQHLDLIRVVARRVGELKDEVVSLSGARVRPARRS